MGKNSILAGLAAGAVLASASIVSAAASLSAVPFVGADTTNTAQGLTTDGRYVVGTSGTANGYIYDTSSGNVFTYDRPGGGRLSLKSTGVGYRTLGGVNQLVVHGGQPEGYNNIWTFDLSGQPGASGLWTSTNNWATTGEAAALGTGTYNSLAMEGFGSANGFASAKQGTAAAKARRAALTKIDSTNANLSVLVNSGGSGSLVGGGVSTTGVTGYGILAHENWTAKYPSTTGTTQTNSITGSTAGDLFAMSADGTRAFGYTPSANTNAYAFDMDSNGAFTATYQLPTPGATSTSLPYGSSADGKYAVGKIYNGIDNAVLWDLTNTAAITVTDLTTLASNLGILGTWTQLSRSTSIGVDGSGNLVISGLGTNNGFTQAFVLTLPEPATLSFLAIGGLLMFRRRR